MSAATTEASSFLHNLDVALRLQGSSLDEFVTMAVWQDWTQRQMQDELFERYRLRASTPTLRKLKKS